MKFSSPVLVGNNAPFHFLMILANTDREPGAQFAVVERVYYTKHLTLVKAQPIWRLFFIFKMCADVEGVAHI